MRQVFDFIEADASWKNLLGGKGANLAEMCKLGLPVPEGFTITTEACRAYSKNGKSHILSIEGEIKEAIARLESVSGRRFGDETDPLLVSVRSGAPVSMPGMMDTVLNLGLNEKTTEALGKITGNMSFAYDTYRRFIQMYSDVVLNIPKYHFDGVLNSRLNHHKVDNFIELDLSVMEEIIKSYFHVVKVEKGISFPVDPWDQLMTAIEAVFESWNNPRAVLYRRINDIADDMGTAVNVQRMVFGNYDSSSGTGVVFTRNPSDGTPGLYGEFLLNAQGEDVVAGIRTPNKIEKLQELLPACFEELSKVCGRLEKHYLDMQDIEFTIESEKLYMLQTRNGKRTARAALRVARDLVNESLIDKETAITRIDTKYVDQLLHPTFVQTSAKPRVALTTGLPASPGAAVGAVYFYSEDVVAAKKRGEQAILVRRETSPEDIEGMLHAEGIITARGGMTSHAAVVARSMGKCCVAGCSEMNVNEELGIIEVGHITVKKGEILSIDGSTGEIFIGEIEKESSLKDDLLETFLVWSKELSKIGVLSNCDSPKDAITALNFGAQGIGLCRTEHMFFEKSRIKLVRQMILAESLEERQEALQGLLPFQREDFMGMFSALNGKPIVIRLLDPPLHEFLPTGHDDIVLLAEEFNRPVSEIESLLSRLEEVNPMLGHRGCRLAITYPEIYEMQTRAIVEAAIKVKEQGTPVDVGIMIPLVGFVKEFKILKQLVEQEVLNICKTHDTTLNYQIGTMIEVPRAALCADEIAEHADFFSFGTNDLTQMTLGFSRDDSGKFIHVYKDKQIFDADPFESLDIEGVGKLVATAAKLGKGANKDLKLGLCGEQGGDAKTIAFCLETKLDYVSCSPFRVPGALIAAAQASVKQTRLLNSDVMG
ncbi:MULTISPECIES: pyruvate, phosphate dikinase [unclassified Fusibacter]|uniref:pyruvate, phosphate dikinase n=1 Tax=unclassified Fusibacter TaxID=2624464 RepID=UPI0010105126|nr:MULTISPECIES: pyruvate, phosphate dikinase [unclassified Fusibacter]MCK8058116.1 pyruvate, phosphate dikinase [Fusibacter sp. A2]NPE20698.1 pyruvate, phosphate dikinase [Fusibacter sp. A1]RXV62903.1 pyruvate, phosphate dikinase [Fusibacter sp. A1]